MPQEESLTSPPRCSFQGSRTCGVSQRREGSELVFGPWKSRHHEPFHRRSHTATRENLSLGSQECERKGDSNFHQLFCGYGKGCEERIGKETRHGADTEGRKVMKSQACSELDRKLSGIIGAEAGLPESIRFHIWR